MGNSYSIAFHCLFWITGGYYRPSLTNLLPQSHESDGPSEVPPGWCKRIMFHITLQFRIVPIFRHTHITTPIFSDRLSQEREIVPALLVQNWNHLDPMIQTLLRNPMIIGAAECKHLCWSLHSW